VVTVAMAALELRAAREVLAATVVWVSIGVPETEVAVVTVAQVAMVVAVRVAAVEPAWVSTPLGLVPRPPATETVSCRGRNCRWTWPEAADAVALAGVRPVRRGWWPRLAWRETTWT